MIPIGRLSALCAFLVTCLTGVEAAAEVRIEGTWSYSISGDQATLEVDRIVNYSSTVTTGTLYLTLWLTTSPDPYTTGHSAARVSLSALDGDGRLRPNYQYENIRLTTPYTEPAPGTYYVHLYVSQWPDLDTTLDLTTATSTLTVEPEASTLIDMTGSVSYLISGDELTLEVERIANTGSRWTSGTLHLTLWLTATPDPYTNGYMAGRGSLAGRYGDNGTLPPGHSFYNVRLTMPYAAPPPGTYYVHLYASEYPDLDTALDLETFTRPLDLVRDDHGDESADATPVALQSRTRGEIQWRGDVDMFRVRVAAAGTLRVGTTGPTDTRGSLSDAQGRLVAADDDGGERLNFQISQSVGPGVWYVAVRGFSRGTLGGYVLTVAFERDAPDPSASRASVAGSHLGDFDGDGQGDVLLRHADGRWYLYPMDGRQAKSDRGAVNLTRDLDYSVAGIGDFNGDGKDDVLLRHLTGAWLYYPMNGRRVLSDAQGQANITTDIEYEVAGIGDFNGDGRDDVMLRHRDGRWRYYPMNGRLVAGPGPSQANLTSNTDFKVAGIGDFDGDGREDVLLRHRDGRWHYYPMNGARTVAGRGAANLTRDLDYSVAGIGNFDGDGRDDVMLRHTDGRWHYYRMNGRRFVSGSGSASLTKNTDYRVAGVGDLNGDGRDDLLLRHAEGRWYFYPMNGRRAGSGRGSANLTRDLRWSIPGPPQLPVQNGGTISGTLAIAPGQVLDSDTPDPGNSRQENDTIASAQRIPSPVSVAGHASADDDAHDVYLLALPAPTRISLAIADAGADLDLHLAETDGTIIAESLGVDDLEAIHTNRTGDHLVIVSAYSGASNYTLVAAVSRTTNRSEAAASTLLGSSSRDGAFVAGELIVNVPASGTKAAAALPVGATNDLMRMGLSPHTVTPSGTVLVRSEGTGSLMGTAGSLPSGFRYADAALRERAVTLLQRKRLLASGRFDGVQPNYIYRPMAVPNDPYFPHQWHYPFIGLPQAWDITTGDDDVIIAVIDSGVVTDHPDLASRMLLDRRDRPVGYDFINDPNRAADGDGIDSDPYDVGSGDLPGAASSFHGTHVAGTIGAATNNAQGVAGVMWRGRILPIRVLGRGGGTSADIAEGIWYAAGLPNVSGTVPPRGADIINLSLGIPNSDCVPYGPVDSATRSAIEGAIGAGAIVVVASGNDNCHWPDPMTTIDDVVAVGASDQVGRAPYSNFGSELDVVAPGGNVQADVDGDGWADGVLSAAADDSGEDVEPIYFFQQGTSMAAPHVAGVFGLMLSVNPRLEPADMTRLLAGTHPDPAAGPITRDWGAPGRDHEFGHGLIDASRAVRVARAIQGGNATDPPDRPVLAVSPTSLHFDATATVLRMELSNVGTGTLSTRSVSPTRAWMSVSFDEWPTVVVNVDRTGLSEGTFAGNIQIDSDGGSVGVPVTLRVQRTVTPADVGRVYVLALDPEAHETQAHTATSAREGYAFALPELPAGQYVVAAGTDRDNDGYICDAGEACGVWPLRDSPSVVDLGGDRRVDFGVSIDLFASIVSQSSRASRVAPGGFRIETP